MRSWKTRARHKPRRIFLHTRNGNGHVVIAVETTREDPFRFYHDIYCWNGTVAIRSIPHNNNSSSMSLPYLFFTYYSPRIYLSLLYAIPQEYIRPALNFIHATRSACLHRRSFCQRALLIAESLIMGCTFTENTPLFLNKSIPRVILN